MNNIGQDTFKSKCDRSINIYSMGYIPDNLYYSNPSSVQELTYSTTVFEQRYDSLKDGLRLSEEYLEFVSLLKKHKVKFMIVGGYAVYVYGYLRLISDIDFWIKPQFLNIAKLANAVREFTNCVDCIPLLTDLKDGHVVQIGFPPNRIDLLVGFKGLDFNSCYNRRSTVFCSDMKLSIIGLADLKKSKMNTGRQKDFDDIAYLQNVSV